MAFKFGSGDRLAPDIQRMGGSHWLAKQAAHNSMGIAPHPMAHFDDGGIVPAGGGVSGQSGIGGVAPTSANQNPLTQGMIQRYASMPVEQLQQMAAMLGGTQQGQIVQSVLRQKQMTGQGAAPAGQRPMAGQAVPSIGTPIPQQPGQIPQTAARGGAIRRDSGGGIPGQGFLGGSTMGRADAIQTTAPGGSYILPADVISALGDGNSIAGASVMDRALGVGPHGIPLERGSRGSGPPRAPQPYPIGQRAGGVTPEHGITPVMLSDGEYSISPVHVARIGGGDIKKGHRILDKFVLEVRKKHIAKLKRLPGPVKP